MMRRTMLGVALCAAGTLVGVGQVAGQERPNTPEVQEDPIFASLFPPELIMQHRRAIELDDQQRDAISRLIANAQGRALSMQWELLDEMEELGSITSGERVDLDRAIDQMGDVLDKEKEIKQAHLEMLVRIKNLLTPRQQAMLRQFRQQAEGGRPGGS